MTNEHSLFNKSIVLNSLGEDIKVAITLSNKAKRIIIRISQGSVKLVLPNDNYYIGYKFLLEKESWIRKKLQIHSINSKIDENIIPIFGEKYSIDYIDLNHKIVKVKNKNIYVYAETLLQKNTLIKFLQEKLLTEINNIIIPLSEKYKIKVNNIRIMDNKTRWGSCSSNAVLAFNWRLIFADKTVLKYLIVHEMSHIIQMNHSKNFWNLVEKIYPEYKNPKSWLKKNGIILYQYLNFV